MAMPKAGGPPGWEVTRTGGGSHGRFPRPTSQLELMEIGHTPKSTDFRRPVGLGQTCREGQTAMGQCFFFHGTNWGEVTVGVRGSWFRWSSCVV